MKHPLLLALIFYYIERGSRQAEFRYFQSFSGTINETSHRLESVAAASLYFTFLGMPGSGAFKIFHPLLFTKALDVFKVRIVFNHLRGKTSCDSKYKVVALFKAARSSPSRQKGRRQVQTNTSKFFFVDLNHQGASQTQSQSQSTMREEDDGLEELTPEEEERLMLGLSHAVTSLQLTLANCR